ncbi:MAG: hypothetical protein R3Y09_02615 [Clostridia bacterium]
MDTNKFITSDEVAIELGVSKSQAYKILQKLNAELREKDFFTIAGKVSRQFFEEKFYGFKESGE